MDGIDWNRLGRALRSLDELLDAAERGESVPSMAIAGRSNRPGSVSELHLEASVGLTNGNAAPPPEAMEVDRGLINGFAREGDARSPSRRARRAAWGARARRSRRAREALERKAREAPPNLRSL
jgi:hypothetical protein